MPRKLKDIDVDEISLVPEAANRKTFFILKRRNLMDEELKALLSEFFDDEDVAEIEKMATEVADVDDVEKQKKLSQQALNAIKGAFNMLNKYKADLPDDLAGALKTLAKYAAAKAYPYPYPQKAKVDKAGAKLSKATREQLAKILALLKESPKAIAMLKTLLGQEVEKADDDDGQEGLSPEVEAKLAKLAEYEKAEKEQLEKDAKEKAEAEKKAKEDLEKRVEALEKKKGIKKSIDGQEDDADDEDEKDDNWPSLYVPGLPEGKE